MNLTRIALVLCVAACGWAAWPRQVPVRDSHWTTREFVIGLTLARLDDAVVVLGDSIVEASTLPRSICGHPIVNAGIGGTSTESGLVEMLKQALGDKRAALVVVALGSNDAAIPESVERYGANYRSMLSDLLALTPRRAIMAIPPPEPGLEQAAKVSIAAIDSYNAALPDIAQEARATFIALPAMPAAHTLDGLHLDASGYAVWDQAILQGIDAALCKATGKMSRE
jgi:lysophospholipase L1-like esterase